MENTSSCARCGGPLVGGHCQACAQSTDSRFVHREIVVLVLLCAAVVVGLILTRAAAHANRRVRLRDAGSWYIAGQHHLASGRTEAAITALRRATAINRDDRTYRLALGEALASARQDDAARQLLLGVRESAPEDPEVNVQLARLEARHDDLTGALRYYRSAVYGAWSPDQTEARRQVRMELIRHLLAHEERGQALSELLVLSSNLPDDVELQTKAGRLFLDAGEPRRALDRFRQALAIDPRHEPALAGAGEAAFELGDYASAQRYLRAGDPASSRLSELRVVTDLVLTRDPLRPGLSLRQRQERAMAGLSRATEVLDHCLGQPQTDNTFEALRAEASALEPKLALGRLSRSPDAIETSVDLVYRIEQQMAQPCGRPSALDRALLLIGRRHEAARQ